MTLKEAWQMVQAVNSEKLYTGISGGEDNWQNLGTAGFPVVTYGCQSWIIKKGEC